MVVLCLILSFGFAVTDEMGNAGSDANPAPMPGRGPGFPELNWEMKTPMPTPRFGMAVAATNGLLYAVGGYSGLRLTLNEAYDPAGDTWTTKAPMVNARNGCYGASLDGWVYVVGGYNGSARLNIVEGYDAAADTWYTLPLMSLERTVPAAVGLGGKLYVVGGFDGTSYHRTVERYDPATNAWDTVAPMPTGRSGLAAAVLNGRLYVMGGWTGSEPTRTEFEMYDPAGDSWTMLPRLPTGRMYLTVAALDGYVLAIGGQLTFNGPQVDIVEAYDTTTNEWTSANPMLLSRGSLGAATINNKTYAVGGWTGSSFLDENDRGEILTGINRQEGPGASRFALSAYPNPFRSQTVIRPTSTPWNTRLTIRDAAGRLVRTLAASGAGREEWGIAWDRTDDAGNTVEPGVYFCSTGNGGEAAETKLVVLP
jgi:hypothetical protein